MNHVLGLSALFLPLIGAIIVAVPGVIRPKWSGIVTSSCVSLAALSSILLLFLSEADRDIIVMAQWMKVGDLTIEWAVRLDTLSMVMMGIVTFVSALVHIYSIGYMAHDRSPSRFFSFLSLFTFAMLVLVCADNLGMLFLGWEGVGLCSYLLIGFWFEKDSANRAAIKAFVVNRIGDFAFVIGLCVLFAAYGTLQFDALFARIEADPGIDMVLFSQPISILTLAAGLILFGAMGKSAQIGLHVWLPDAMEGPTPVSALIHAATMVTAGVFIIARFSPLYALTPEVRDVILIIGAFGAFFAAVAATAQHDIKRAIAWSTCSQLGYMFLALGLSAWGVAIFHLMTHAFFKGLLFLAAGSVIHALHDEQDMRKMGGLASLLPYTCGAMIIGSAALAGVPFLSGYYSKDQIMEIAWGDPTWVGSVAFTLAFAALALTALYATRIVLRTFFGSRHSRLEVAKIHESPPVMLVPLALLSLGAVISGMVARTFFSGADQSVFWGSSLEATQYRQALASIDSIPAFVFWLPSATALVVIAVTIIFYILPRILPRIFPHGLPRILPHGLFKVKRSSSIYASMVAIGGFFRDGWRWDAMYESYVIRPIAGLARVLAGWVEIRVIDRFGPDGIALSIRWIGQRMAWLHSGYLYHYAFAMIIGIILFALWVNFRLGGIG